MVEVITYSLRSGAKNSDQYYRDIARFTDNVIAYGISRYQNSIEKLIDFIKSSSKEELRSFPEYTFEFLTLGVLWQVYAGEASGSPNLPQRVLSRLVMWRQKSEFFKPAIDFFRGVLSTLFLSSTSRYKYTAVSLENLGQLLNWLNAAGDFREEVKRLNNWQHYLKTLEPGEANKVLDEAIAFADWFDTNSLEILGKYTTKVDQFLAVTHPNYRWREDEIFCGRERIEYHLNMVGTEVLNRAYRDKFLSTDRRVVLLPPCMRAKHNGDCQAVETPFGSLCAACTPGCRVHQVTKLGEKHGFEVVIMPHELSAFSGTKMQPMKNGAPGIVGVSCPLTNVTGGWETRDLGIPAQGVLLDYCGCVWHWHLEGGIPTDINFDQLLRVVKE
jgi:hypothetical protein